MVARHSLWTIPCILAAIQLVQASTKGVAPEKLDLYRPDNKQQWKCLDGSKTIPFSAINDDYCDCADGSDEPGTSACANGYYYCENKGHIPAYIKSWSVNDGVCDDACCDGSDEYNGLTQCPNRCKQVASEYQKTQAEMRRLTNEGYAVKKKLIEQGEMMVRDWQEEKSKHEDDLILKRGELERYQREIDVLEKEHAPTKRQPQCTQNTARQELLENRVKQLRDEIDVLLSILHDMKRDHNHNVQDKAVKIAIAGYDDFLVEYEQLCQDMDHVDVELEEEDDDFANQEEPTTESEGKHASTITKKIMGKLDKVLPSSWKDRIFSNTEDGQHSTELDRLRQARDGLDSDIRALETKVKDLDEKLNNDYGKEREWLKLQNTCVEKDDGEYIYSLCILAGASQKSHKDGSNINLGQFEKFVGENDDALYLQHAHTHGLRCWNGPERSVRAIYECGGKTEILDVMEPEKCEYHFRVRTPAVCPNPEDIQGIPEQKVIGHVHEEL